MSQKALVVLDSLREDQRMAALLVEHEVLPPFDYTMLEADTASMVRAAAERVRSKVTQARANMIGIGRELIAVKAKLPHGQFGGWLAAEFQWDQRTAQNYMNVAEKFAEQTELVSHLPAAATQKLAAPSTPPEVREDISKRVREGERFTAKAVKLLVKAAIASSKVAKAEAALTPRQKTASEKKAQQRREEDTRHRREDQLRQQQRVELAAAGVSMIGQFGPSIAGLEPFLEVWREMEGGVRALVRALLDVPATNGDASVTGTTDKSVQTLVGPGLADETVGDFAAALPLLQGAITTPAAAAPLETTPT